MNLFAGLDEMTVTDTEGAVTFPMLLMYPTAGAPQSLQLGPYTFEAALKAPIKTGRFPLVLISHGSGSSNQVFRTLAAHLAKNGFVVAMPEHPFNNRNNNDHVDTIENLVDRPRHIRCAIDAIFSSSPWKDHVQAEKVAIVGHSLGGYTALALAGGLPHTQHQIQHDPKTKLTRSQAISVIPDPRIKTLVLLAPAAGAFASAGALNAVDRPILIVSGEHDNITPLFHAEIVTRGVPLSTQVVHRVIPNGDHFSFLSPFPESMKKPGFAPAHDRAGFDREKFLSGMNQEILTFLNLHLELTDSA